MSQATIQAASPNDRVRLWQRSAAAFALLVMAVFAHGTIVNNDFISLDDAQYIFENTQVVKGLSAETLTWAFTSVNVGNWHPLTMLSHLCDVSLFGLDPAGHHATALLFHGVNAVLLLVVLAKLTGSFWRSWFVAALFALHPAHVESVAWVSSRKDLLSLFFILLTMLAYARWVSNGRRWSDYLPLTLGFACALMSKPTAVTLPALLLLLDFWPLRRADAPGTPQDSFMQSARNYARKLPALLLEKLPLVLLAALMSTVTFIVQRASGAVASVEQIPLDARLANIPVAYARYLKTLLWPDGLAVLYPHPIYWPIASVLLSAMLLLAVTLGLFYLANRYNKQYLPVGWLWFLGVLVPMIGLVQVGVQSMADRYVYIPFIGLYILMVWSAADLIEAVPRLRQPVLAAAVVMLGILGVLSHRQSERWVSSIVLFTHGIEVTGKNAALEDFLGRTYSMMGNYELAAKHFHNSLAVNPSQPLTLENLGYASMVLDRPQDAVAAYRAAAAIRPLTGSSRQNLGWALLLTGSPEEAHAVFRELYRESGPTPQVLTGIAASDGALGRVEESLALFRQVKARWPGFTNADYQAALVLVNNGQPRRALALLERLVAAEPDNLAAGRLLARAYARLGMKQQARHVLGVILQKYPTDSKALEALHALEQPAAGPAGEPGATPR